MINSNLTSIENLRNNFTNIKEEGIGLAKKWDITPEFEKKRHRKFRQFFDHFNADEKLQDKKRLFEMDVFKANVDVITTQLKSRFESMNGIYKSFSFLSPKILSSHERCDFAYSITQHIACTAGIMDWMTLAYDSRSAIIVMRGTLTGQHYADMPFLEPK
ncbi:hypothetical protein TNCV_4212031 [Trichonephila clavipes]|nr:hypothetical protein TNCV_4212031 [Trichonephila clavipes]